jgi:hypothetical protein
MIPAYCATFRRDAPSGDLTFRLRKIGGRYKWCCDHNSKHDTVTFRRVLEALAWAKRQGWDVRELK